MSSKIKEDLSNRPKLLTLLNMMREGNTTKIIEHSTLLSSCIIRGRYLKYEIPSNIKRIPTGFLDFKAH